MPVQQHDGSPVDDQLRKLWQAQELEGGKMSLVEVRTRVGTFERKIRNRNRLEYVGAALVLWSFGRQVFQPTPENFMTRIAAALTVLATLYVVYTLRTRGSVKNVPDTMGRASVVEFYRASLESQRDLLRNVWRWYLLPFVPGMVATFVSFAIRDGVLLSSLPSSARMWPALSLLLFASILAGFFFFVSTLNGRAAEKLQAEIDALEHQS